MVSFQESTESSNAEFLHVAAQRQKSRQPEINENNVGKLSIKPPVLMLRRAFDIKFNCKQLYVKLPSMDHHPEGKCF